MSVTELSQALNVSEDKICEHFLPPLLPYPLMPIMMMREIPE